MLILSVASLLLHVLNSLALQPVPNSLSPIVMISVDTSCILPLSAPFVLLERFDL